MSSNIFKVEERYETSLHLVVPNWTDSILDVIFTSELSESDRGFKDYERHDSTEDRSRASKTGFTKYAFSVIDAVKVRGRYPYA